MKPSVRWPSTHFERCRHMFMVKPGMPYLGIVRRVKTEG